MESPFTGGPATLKTELRELTFRKEPFEIAYHYYRCEDTGEQFTTDALDELNTAQVHNLYREKHSIPFPEEMRKIREKYELSARKMSLILEFGENQYNKYENGAIPSTSNARLIQAAEDPEEFRKILKASDVFQGKKLEEKLEYIDRLIYEESRSVKFSPTEFLLGDRKPTEYNGFRKPDLERVMQMILFFAQKLNPWETGMNKLMFYSDFSFFKRKCFSISGIEYRALEFGPVPKRYAALFEAADEQGYVNIEFDEMRYENTLCKQFLPGEKSFDEGLFSTEELQALKKVAGHFVGKKTSEISETSHKEDAWLENIEKKQLISYSYAFGLKALD